MSNPDPKIVQEQEPIEIWIMTTNNETSDFDNALMSCGGSTRNVEKYYHRNVRIHGVIHHIRGRFELLIRSPQERSRLDEHLTAPYNRQRKDARRLTEEELAAIKTLESDPNNWKSLGGVRTFCHPEDEDLPDYPPVPKKPNVPEEFKPSDNQRAVADMQNEGGPPNPQES